ncbi:hypothetical protein RKE29_14235 [Streptomyces sp. B1866]|nr:hypothetical protein [Streptomyces sp. B1866]MDT3397787.1 hypothetical protein [Streptomyces sp. B1866]
MSKADCDHDWEISPSGNWIRCRKCGARIGD